MKSASNFWIFVLLTSILFNCASRKPESDALPMQKAYVLLRTEGLDTEINKLTSILNSNFVTQNIASDINHYPIGRTWKTNEIFSTAYGNNYDYIILIDQVAKFTIDGKTNVGGKYQIRSYDVKSSNPDWVDLGQKTCNVTVKQSIDKFSQQIISQIVPNYISPKVSFNKDKVNENQQTEISEIDYNKLKSSKEIDLEIAELRKQLENEKEKTNLAMAEKERLEKEYEQTLSFQKKKNQTILEGLESFKKEKELAEKKRKEEERLVEPKQVLKDKTISDAALKEEEKGLKELEQKKEQDRKAEEVRLEKERIAETERFEKIKLKELEKRAKQERLAQTKILKEKQLEEKRLEEIRIKKLKKKAEEDRLEKERIAETKRLEKIKLKELEKRAEQERLTQVNPIENIPKTSLKKKNKKSKIVQKPNKTIDNSNALIIIRGIEEDIESFNKLKDNLEFELLFANIKATTQIFNLKEVVNKKDVLHFNQPNYKYLIFIEQIDTQEDGSSNFGLSVYPSNDNSTWKDLGQKPFNLNDRTSLKEFSKTVLKSL